MRTFLIYPGQSSAHVAYFFSDNINIATENYRWLINVIYGGKEGKE
jgi:hypothetical protein